MGKAELILRDQSEWSRIEITPIIDRKLFEMVQRQREFNKAIVRNRATRKYLLTNMVVCGGCKKAYSAVTQLGGIPREAE